MEPRMMTPEEEATLNVAIMQPDEIFNARVAEALFKIMRGKEFTDYVLMHAEQVAQTRIHDFKHRLAQNIEYQKNLPSIIRETY